MSLRTSSFVLALAWSLAGSLLSPFSSSQAQTLAHPAAATASSNAAWQQLETGEKSALGPLAARWSELTETQRSKWRTIARQFDHLSPTEQAAIHTRMSEWAALSTTQRNQARLNFSTVHKLPKDEKKTKWNEYQALSEAQKRELSAGVLSPNKTAAPSAKPANAERLVQPTVRTLPSTAIPPRPLIDKKTLLPLPAAIADSPAKPSPASGPTVAREASSAS